MLTLSCISAQYQANGISPLGVVIIFCKLNNYSELWKITMYSQVKDSSKKFFLFIHVDSWLLIEFPTGVLPMGNKHIKIMVPLISWSTRTWVTSSGSTCFLLYTHHCLCAMVRQKYKSTGHGNMGHQMGLKSNQMGRIVCVARIRLLEIPEHVEERNETGFKEGISEICYFLLQSVEFLVEYYFCLL